jgi:hypothetical protein
VSSRQAPRRRRPAAELGRVTVRGPGDAGQARALKRAIVRDLAELAVELLAEGRLPPAAPTSPRPKRERPSGA